MQLVTLFDKNYLAKALALYRSLQKTTFSFKLHMFCLDEESHSALMRIIPDTIDDHRIYHPASVQSLKACQMALRYPKPYSFFALAPILTREIYYSCLDRTVSYIDADCYFFKSANHARSESDWASVGIVPHRFPEWDEERLRPNGKYNVSLVTFNRTKIAEMILDRWTMQVLEKCDTTTVGDQKDLDNWPALAPGDIHEYCPEVGLAPWNMANYRLESNEMGKPIMNGKEVVMFHYHELRDNVSPIYLSGYPVDENIRSVIYEPYLKELYEAKLQIKG